MKFREPKYRSSRHSNTLAIAAFAILGATNCVFAVEGGVSFWLPGQYGSFAAVAPEQGFSMPLVT